MYPPSMSTCVREPCHQARRGHIARRATRQLPSPRRVCRCHWNRTSRPTSLWPARDRDRSRRRDRPSQLRRGSFLPRRVVRQALLVTCRAERSVLGMFLVLVEPTAGLPEHHRLPFVPVLALLDDEIITHWVSRSLSVRDTPR